MSRNSESAYIKRLWAVWPHDGNDVPQSVIALARKAVEAFPKSPRLWNLLGDLLQLHTIKGTNVRSRDKHFFRCYLMSIMMDSRFVDGYASLGYCYFVDDDYEMAEVAFRKALSLAPKDRDSLEGLMKVLLETKRRSEAQKIQRKLANIDKKTKRKGTRYGREARAP